MAAIVGYRDDKPDLRKLWSGLVGAEPEVIDAEEFSDLLEESRERARQARREMKHGR